MNCQIGYNKEDRELVVVLPHYSILTRELSYGDMVRITIDTIEDDEGKLHLNLPVRIDGFLLSNEILEVDEVDEMSADKLIEFHRLNPGGNCVFFCDHLSELSDVLFVVLKY